MSKVLEIVVSSQLFLSRKHKEKFQHNYGFQVQRVNALQIWLVLSLREGHNRENGTTLPIAQGCGCKRGASGLRGQIQPSPPCICVLRLESYLLWPGLRMYQCGTEDKYEVPMSALLEGLGLRLGKCYLVWGLHTEKLRVYS